MSQSLPVDVSPGERICHHTLASGPEFRQARGLMNLPAHVMLSALAGSLVPALSAAGPDGFVRLFPEDGVLRGWLVRQWDDVGKAAAAEVKWEVKGGVLHGSEPRGTWLVSEK